MSYNVLIVDDSTIMRKIISTNLIHCGLPIENTYQATNGEEGLKVLKENAVDIVFVDLHMPGMTGDVMVDKIRQNPTMQHLPVVYVSSESRNSRLIELIEGKTGFVHKPFTYEDFRLELTSLGLIAS